MKQEHFHEACYLIDAVRGVYIGSNRYSTTNVGVTKRLSLR